MVERDGPSSANTPERRSAGDPPTGGFAHHPSVEQMLHFRAVPAEEKLRWLEEMRLLVARFVPPERRALMNRFRRGEL